VRSYKVGRNCLRMHTVQEFVRIILASGLFLLVVSGNVADKRFPLEGKQCQSTDPHVPIIKVTSYTREVPLVFAESNQVIFSSFSMARRRLLKEPKPVKNVTEEKTEICLGEGGSKEWSVPVSDKTAYTTEVVVECFDRGIGPVEFEYNGIGDFQVGNHEEMMTAANNSFKHLYMPSDYKLVFKNITDQISGNYSCRSKEFPEKVNYFHLFVPMGGRPYLIQRGKTINITHEAGTSLVTLPCIANNPNAKVFLFKKYVIARMGVIIVKYQHQPFHIYDPKTGFVLNTRDVGVEAWGTYICTSNPDMRDPTDRIRINLMPPAGLSRKADGNYPPSLFRIGSQFMKDSYRRLRHVFNSFFI